MDHIYVVDLPERLSLMIRFFPCFRLMFRRYLWTAAGTRTSGPAVITWCWETFTFIGSLIQEAWLTSMGTAARWVFQRIHHIFIEEITLFTGHLYRKRLWWHEISECKLLIKYSRADMSTSTSIDENLHLAHERSRGQNHCLGALFH